MVKWDPTEPSNWRATERSDDWLRGAAGSAWAGSTRGPDRAIRQQGAPHVALAHDPEGQLRHRGAVPRPAPGRGLVGLDLAKDVTARRLPLERDALGLGRGLSRRDRPRPRVVAIDYGAKRNILRCLASAGCEVTVLPATATAEDILALNPDGLFLSNGPGDPAATGDYAVPMIRGVLAADMPLFGICLGHQMLALALGAQDVKMNHGHHGANHPVKDLTTGKVEITSMNHGFTVDPDPAQGVIETHVASSTASNCGIALDGQPGLLGAVPPRGSPGPQDSYYLFDRFAEAMQAPPRGLTRPPGLTCNALLTLSPQTAPVSLGGSAWVPQNGSVTCRPNPTGPHAALRSVRHFCAPVSSPRTKCSRPCRIRGARRAACRMCCARAAWSWNAISWAVDARNYGLRLVDLDSELPDPRLIDAVGTEDLSAPWPCALAARRRRDDHRHRPPADFARIRPMLEARLGPVAAGIAAPRAILTALHARRGDRLAHAAENRVAPAESCRSWRRLHQAPGALVVIATLMTARSWPRLQPLWSPWLSLVLSLACIVALKIAATHRRAARAAAGPEPASDGIQPVVSIIVALYREADIAAAPCPPPCAARLPGATFWTSSSRSRPRIT